MRRSAGLSSGGSRIEGRAIMICMSKLNLMTRWLRHLDKRWLSRNIRQ
jgi:hypothetical protein